MKVSEVHENIQQQVDALQKQRRNNAHDQLVINQNLEFLQAQMKSLMQTVIKEGDRELTGEELIDLGLRVG